MAWPRCGRTRFRILDYRAAPRDRMRNEMRSHPKIQVKNRWGLRTCAPRKLRFEKPNPQSAPPGFQKPWPHRRHIETDTTFLRNGVILYSFVLWAVTNMRRMDESWCAKARKTAGGSRTKRGIGKNRWTKRWKLWCDRESRKGIPSA